ncbi:MAG TPA: hypothetical protein V6D20_20120 [Candidatus Obscuribacterales bacterium]
MWPVNAVWDWHCGNPEGLFYNLRYFLPPLAARYGNSTSAAQLLYRAQLATYESHRAMFEAYSRNKYTSTGVIQWMFNNAWPENIWHLFDSYMTQPSTYWATKKANENFHLMYSYNDHSIWFVNSLYKAVEGLSASLETRHFVNGSLIEQQNISVAGGPDSTAQVAQLHAPPPHVEVFLVVLSLYKGDALLTDNWYWVANPMDKLDW